MKLLVTGGAGFVGSHSVNALLQAGHDVTILDNLSTGHRWALQGCELIPIDLRDTYHLNRKLKGRGFEGVLHFAAKSLVGESKNQPAMYYQNNVGGTTNLVRAMQAADIQKLVFSSTAAIFGNPISDLIDESIQKLRLTSTVKPNWLSSRCYRLSPKAPILAPPACVTSTQQEPATPRTWASGTNPKRT
jgi:UDP-glucose 4-epimerase